MTTTNTPQTTKPQTTKPQTTTPQTTKPDRAGSVGAGLPLAQLLPLAVAGFLTMLTETVPAGLLPQIGGSFGTSSSTSGQLLTAYAAASTVAAIPLVSRTARVDRKRLIVASILVVVAANVVTAVAPVFWLAVVARVAGGAAAALQWALLAGFAMRLVRPESQGKALAVSMAGIPLALALGVPAGTALGQVMSWRGVFLVLAGVGLALAFWSLVVLPHAAPTASGSRRGLLRRTLSVRGLSVVFLGAGLFQLGHMLVYTYVAAFTADAADGVSVTTLLMVLGVAAIAGLAGTGAVIDRHLGFAAFVAMGLFALAMLVLSLWSQPAALYGAAAVWGAGLGAAPTVFQTAAARVAGSLVDSAQSLLVTIFNAGMALGSALGGVVVAVSGPADLPRVAFVVFAVVLAALFVRRSVALPAHAADLGT